MAAQWPRGISKQQAAIDDWATEVTPSTEPRKWYPADPQARRAEFETRYRLELDNDTARDVLARLRRDAAAGPSTLVTAVKVPGHSHAPVLLGEPVETPTEDGR
ncbi:MAG: hypothetical protein JWN03_3557 [Nocardia sp.]|uniref:DUF488 domain-containing protein n=1 Tax=Nocardia sp. TaxID=1821 RepID=UPI00260F1E40|nr:DUF488 family protein [Nocardia sp.]MCU1643282.1 hypothetical protein [Nocardia sp.]